MNICSGRGRHSYMTRMYADKDIHIVFVLLGRHDVKLMYVGLETDQFQIYSCKTIKAFNIDITHKLPFFFLKSWTFAIRPG